MYLYIHIRSLFGFYLCSSVYLRVYDEIFWVIAPLVALAFPCMYVCTPILFICPSLPFFLRHFVPLYSFHFFFQKGVTCPLN